MDAYKAYIDAYIKLASTAPLDAQATALASMTTTDYLSEISSFLRTKRDAGAVLNVRLGVQLRPFVVAEPRSATEAYVNDCQLDGSYWADTTGTPLSGEKAQVRRNGVLFKMAFVGGSWLVAAAGKQGGACIRS